MQVIAWVVAQGASNVTVIFFGPPVENVLDAFEKIGNGDVVVSPQLIVNVTSPIPLNLPILVVLYIVTVEQSTSYANVALIFSVSVILPSNGTIGPNSSTDDNNGIGNCKSSYLSPFEVT